MPDMHQTNPQNMSFDQLQDYAMGVIHTICGSFSRPIEMILRPWHGSRYFNVAQITLSTLGMLILPTFIAVGETATSLIPFSHPARSIGLFDIGSFSRLFFLLSLIHGFRIYRRMIKPETELHSRWEGPPLFFFRFLPKSDSVYFVRIVLEPLFVFIAATILANLTIITPGLCLFLHFSALCLALKEFVVWYANFIYFRDILDSRAMGPIISKLLDDSATQEDLAPAHLASFPKGISPELRQDAAYYIARKYEVNIPKGDDSWKSETNNSPSRQQ
jgi:hypothetical protein